MDECCEHLEDCGYFLHFKGNSEVVKRGWVNLYCLRKVNAHNCERLKQWNRDGALPPDNVAPNGRRIGE